MGSSGYYTTEDFSRKKLLRSNWIRKVIQVLYQGRSEWKLIHPKMEVQMFPCQCCTAPASIWTQDPLIPRNASYRLSHRAVTMITLTRKLPILSFFLRFVTFLSGRSNRSASKTLDSGNMSVIRTRWKCWSSLRTYLATDSGFPVSKGLRPSSLISLLKGIITPSFSLVVWYFKLEVNSTRDPWSMHL